MSKNIKWPTDNKISEETKKDIIADKERKDKEIKARAEETKFKQRMSMGTPPKPDRNSSDLIWKKLFPGISKLSESEKNDFKKAVEKMNSGSWEFWMKPVAALNGYSRAESYTFPMNPNQFDTASITKFGDKRPATSNNPTRSHGRLDIYGYGGKNGEDGHEIKACTEGTVVSVTNYVGETKIVTVVSKDGSVINYGEIASNVKVGDKITQGQTIGKTKVMQNDSMLHIEFYEGKPSDKEAAIKAANEKVGTNIVETGSVNSSNMDYVNSNKYNNLPFDRREDMHDPTIVVALQV